MSSTTTAPSPSPSGPPSGPSQPPSNNGGGGPSSSLYLFTFLATLFLLLFVSSAIILRSFILRRRFRQRIEEAILAGVITPNQPGGRVNRRRALGEKPKLWEASVFPADDDGWNSIVPVSALPKSSEPARDEDGEAYPPPRSYSPSYIQPPRRPPLYRRLLPNPFAARQGGAGAGSGSLTPPRAMAAAASFASAGENASSGQGQGGALPHHDRMQVTVLIAMPDARRPHLDGKGGLKGKDFDYYEEDDLPEMVLGMVEPRYKDAPTPPTSP